MMTPVICNLFDLYICIQQVYFLRFLMFHNVEFTLIQYEAHDTCRSSTACSTYELQ